MKLLIVQLGALLLISTANAGQTLRSVSWSDMSAVGKLLNGSVVPGSVLELDYGDQAESTRPICELFDPGITTPVHAITGEVRCENVRGRGYLEMWSHFADGGAYFSRTLGRGPLAPLEGNSGWRPFVVPFYNRPEGPPPVRLSFGVRYPGSGRVRLRSVRWAWCRGSASLRSSWVSLRSHGRSRMPSIIPSPCSVLSPRCCRLRSRRCLRKRYEDAELRRMASLDAGS